MIIIATTIEGIKRLQKNTSMTNFLQQGESCKFLLVLKKTDTEKKIAESYFEKKGFIFEKITLPEHYGISEQTGKLKQQIETLSNVRNEPASECTIWIIVNGFPAGIYEELSLYLRGVDYCNCQPFNPDSSINLPSEIWQHKNSSAVLDETLLPYQADFLDSNETRQVQSALVSPRSVLISGAVGMGKTMLAKFIHDHFEPTAGANFVPINLSGLSESLAIAELKGTVKGAFTGAENRTGLLHKANGGSLFLDEIAEANTRVQVKLLDIAQPRLMPVSFEKVGSHETEKSVVRFIAATNRPEHDWAKHFRKDLCSRLPIRIHIKSLYDKVPDSMSFFKKAIEYFTDCYFIGNPLIAPKWDNDSIEKAVNAHILPDNLRDLRFFIESLLEALLIKKKILTHEKFLIDFEVIEEACSARELKSDSHTRPKPTEGFINEFLENIDVLKFSAEDKQYLTQLSEEKMQEIVYKLKRVAFDAAVIAASGNEAKARRMAGIKKPSLFKSILNDPSRQYFHPRTSKRKA